MMRQAFDNALGNEFQWSNLYLSKWHSCTYRVGTWRDTYQLRRKCPWYPLLLWVTDTEYEHWHLIFMLQLARAAERGAVLDSLVHLISVSDGDLIAFVIALVTQEMSEPVKALLPSFSFSVEQSTPALFTSLAQRYGAGFLQRLIGPFLRKKLLQDEAEELKSVKSRDTERTEGRTAVKIVARVAEELINRIGLLAESIPLEMWTCMVLAQRLHNKRVLEFLEVPGFDTRLITVTGTKESVNPRSKEVLHNVVIAELLLGCWVIPALQNLVNWGVTVHRKMSVVAALGLQTFMEKVAVLFSGMLVPRPDVVVDPLLQDHLVTSLDYVMNAAPLHMRQVVTVPRDSDVAAASHVINAMLYQTRSRMIGRLLEVESLAQAKVLAERVKSISLEMATASNNA